MLIGPYYVKKKNISLTVDTKDERLNASDHAGKIGKLCDKLNVYDLEPYKEPDVRYRNHVRVMAAAGRDLVTSGKD